MSQWKTNTRTRKKFKIAGKSYVEELEIEDGKVVDQKYRDSKGRYVHRPSGRPDPK